MWYKWYREAVQGVSQYEADDEVSTEDLSLVRHKSVEFWITSISIIIVYFADSRYKTGSKTPREDSAVPTGMTAAYNTHTRTDIHMEDLPVVTRHTRSLAALFV